MKAYTITANGGERIYSYAPVSGENGSGVGSAIGGAAALSGPVGAIIGTVLSFIGSLGGLLRGSTQHLSYSVVAPVAAQFAGTIYNKLKASLGADFETTNKSLVPILVNRMQTLMQQYWGLGPSLNQQIYRDLEKSYAGQLAAPVYEILWRYYLWVGTNLDQNAGDDTKKQYFADLFNAIFIDGLREAGVSIDKLAKDLSGYVAGSTGTTPGTGTGTGGTGTGTKLAGFSGPLGIVAVAALLGAVIYSSRKGQAAAA